MNRVPVESIVKAGIRFTAEEVESVTLKRDGCYVEIWPIDKEPEEEEDEHV